MTAEEAEDQDALLPDEEVRERVMANPEIRVRAKRLAQEVRRGKTVGAGLKAEELPNFLHQHGLDFRQAGTR